MKNDKYLNKYLQSLEILCYPFNGGKIYPLQIMRQYILSLINLYRYYIPKKCWTDDLLKLDSIVCRINNQLNNEKSKRIECSIAIQQSILKLLENFKYVKCEKLMNNSIPLISINKTPNCVDLKGIKYYLDGNDQPRIILRYKQGTQKSEEEIKRISKMFLNNNKN